MIVNLYLLTGYNWDRFLIENNVLGRPYCAVAAMGYCWTGNEKQFLVMCAMYLDVVLILHVLVFSIQLI